MNEPNPHPDAPSAEELLRHAAFLTGLARAILRDEHAAEDAVQEAYAVAIAAPPARGGNLRGWLAGVTRNLARMAVRTSARRSAREAGAGAASAPVPATAETVEKLETGRHLVSAVLALAEPYRTTITLRFFDGLSPSAIARRQGAPVKTVHTRIRRGLLLLRERLEREDRPRWRAGLLLLAGGAVMTTKKAVAAAAIAALLVAGTMLVLPRSDAPKPPAVETVPPPAPAVATADAGGTDLEEPAAAPAPSGDWTLAVRVAAPDRPGAAPVGLKGARVVFLDGERKPVAEATTDEDGLAELDVRCSGSLGVVAFGFAPGLVEGLAPPESGRREVDYTPTNGPGISGVVLGANGRPVSRRERVLLRATPVEPAPWYGEPRIPWHGATGADGRFHIRNLPAGRFRIGIDGGGPAGQPPSPVEAETGEENVVIDLVPPRGLKLVFCDAETGEPLAETGVTRIEVLDEEGAVIRLSVHAHTEGELEIWDLPDSKARIRVSTPDRETTEIAEAEVIPGRPPPAVTIALQASSARITLVVRDAAGRPVEHFELSRIERMLSNRSIHSRRCDAPDGRVELPLRADDHFYLLRGPDGVAPVALTLRVAPGERRERLVVLGATGAIRVVLPESAGTGYVPISFHAADGREILPECDRSGPRRYHGIEPGEYVVTATLDGEKLERRVVVTAGETVVADFVEK